jgi:hypothetical protein
MIGFEVFKAVTMKITFLLGCDAVYSGGKVPTFRKNVIDLLPDYTT